jgi:hypothetical protein
MVFSAGSVITGRRCSTSHGGVHGRRPCVAIRRRHWVAGGRVPRPARFEIEARPTDYAGGWKGEGGGSLVRSCFDGTLLREQRRQRSPASSRRSKAEDRVMPGKPHRWQAKGNVLRARYSLFACELHASAGEKKLVREVFLLPSEPFFLPSEVFFLRSEPFFPRSEVFILPSERCFPRSELFFLPSAAISPRPRRRIRVRSLRTRDRELSTGRRG